MNVEENQMRNEHFAIDDSQYVKEMENAENKMMLFLTNTLLKTIGSSKTLILITGLN